MKFCSFCGEKILAVAKKCKHCKKFIENTTSNFDSQKTKNIKQTEEIKNRKLVLSVAKKYLRLQKNVNIVRNLLKIQQVIMIHKKLKILNRPKKQNKRKMIFLLLNQTK